MMNSKNYLKGIMFFIILVCSVYAEKPKDVPDGWWNQVQKDIASSEYNITWQEKPAIEGLGPCWQAPNRALNTRTYFTNNGPRVVRRTEEKPSWIWGLELVGMRNVECGMRNEEFGTRNAECGTENLEVGGEGQFAPLPIDKIVPEKNRIEYRRGDVIEWYVNDQKGLEQGFTISSPSSSFSLHPSSFHLALAVRGTLRASQPKPGGVIQFQTEGDVTVMQYASPKAVDASGQIPSDSNVPDRKSMSSE